MFVELEKKRIEFPFGATRLWLRFDNKAFLSIEKAGFSPFDTRALEENAAAARAFISAGLQNCLEELSSTAKTNEIVNALMGEDKSSLIKIIQYAILQALPEDAPNKKTQKNTEKGGAGMLFSLYCDVMYRPEEEFWCATLREVTERWERYAILKGYRQAPLQIQRYDD